jgi:creatinine amidohydrolase
MTAWANLSGLQIGELIDAGRTLAVFPIGATEQHGSHLATGTDTLLSEWICREACRRCNLPMLPVLPYGCSLGHTKAWPGTLSLTPDTLAKVIYEVAGWAIGATKIDRLMFISGHATNGPSIESALLQLRYEFPEVRFATRGLWDISQEALRIYTTDGADTHANIAETSMVLAIEPDKVCMERAQDVEDRSIGLVWRYAMPAMTSTGVVGHPTKSSAALGRQMLDRIVDDLVALLSQAEREAWPAVVTPTFDKRKPE